MSYGVELPPPKKACLDMLKRLRDDVTYDDILYHIEVMKGVQAGVDDINNGRVLSAEEVDREMDEWLKSYGPEGNEH